MGISQIIVDIQHALRTIKNESAGHITDYQQQKQEGTRLMLKGAIQQLLNETKHDPEARQLAKQLADAPPEKMQTYLDKLAELAAGIEGKRKTRLPRLPADINDEITADLKEIEKCMQASCFRSAVILCGRVMETALHRTYYDTTGNDLLEKAPGIGLGSLIAKLSEKGVKLDPGLPNQIHLINQVRVHSVHKKKDAFVPTKSQAEAIVLYTTDILDRLFA